MNAIRNKMPSEDSVPGIILAVTKAFPGIIAEAVIYVLCMGTAPSES